MKYASSLSIRAIISFALVIATISIVAAYGTDNPPVFGHTASEIDFTSFGGNFSTNASVIASSVCIGGDCRTSWPTAFNASTVTFLNVTNSIITNVFNSTNLFSTNATSLFLTSNFINATNLTSVFITTNILNTTNLFTSNLNASVINATTVCIGGDCRTSWPTFSSTIINSTVIINNASTLNLTTFSSSNFIINGTVFLNGTLVLNNTAGTVVVVNNSFFTTLNNTFVTTNVVNNTIMVPNPIDLTSIAGNVIASGDVQGSRLCIAGDCRTSWPTASGSGSGTGSPTLIFQAQRFIDDDTNYFIDMNSGANLAGTWTLNGELRANSICIGGDCRTSWPTSDSSSGVDKFTVTVGALENGCHDSGNTAHFMNTCGHRYCVANGYETGMVVEYSGNNAQDPAEVACFD